MKHCAFDALDVDAGHAFFAQDIRQIPAHPFDIILDRFVHLDSKNEMAPALKIKAKIYSIGWQKIGPPRRQ
jgi:hypothetical protein